MFTAAQKRLVLALILAPAGALAAERPGPEGAGELAHMREELGVNAFTAPSIGVLFEQLEALKPIPFDKAWRDLPDAAPQERARLALSAGQVIADGFLAVSAEKQSRLKPVSRALLRLAKGLGVGDHVTRHAKSILELALLEHWPEIKAELIQAQAEVEAGMMALKDEEIAHLVSLGGWLRGLEITASIVVEGYTPERARTLAQPELFEYFAARVETLNPNLQKTPVIILLGRNLREIRKLTDRPASTPIEPAEVKQIRDLAREINQAIAGEV